MKGLTAYETFENVVITSFYEQGTDENYYDFLHYSVWIPNFELRFLLERTGAAPAEEAPAAEVEAS